MFVIWSSDHGIGSSFKHIFTCNQKNGSLWKKKKNLQLFWEWPFLLLSLGARKVRWWESLGPVNFYQSPSTGGIASQYRAHSNWQLSFGQGTQAGHFSLFFGGQWFQSSSQRDSARTFLWERKKKCMNIMQWSELKWKAKCLRSQENLISMNYRKLLCFWMNCDTQ